MSKNPGAPDSACGTTPASCQKGTCNGSGGCTKADDGTSCGTSNMYCNQGNCGSCDPTVDCTLPNHSTSCQKWQNSCATGLPVCQQTSTNRADSTSCGAGQTCAQATQTAAHLCSGGVCTAPTTPCGAIGCNGAGTACATAQCGNGTKEPGEDCDNGASNTNNTYCSPPNASCSLCSTSCHVVIGNYCGDGYIQSAYEACDLGAGNGVLSTCSPTCTTCGNLPGLEPQLHNDTDWASGLYFVATKAATLYRFEVYHNNASYRVELYQVNTTTLANSTLVWTTGTSWSTPVSAGYDAQLLNYPNGVALTAGATYLLLKYGQSMASQGPSPTFPTASAGGITVTSSFECGVESADQWYNGVPSISFWYDFMNLQSCLQNHI